MVSDGIALGATWWNWQGGLAVTFAVLCDVVTFIFVNSTHLQRKARAHIFEVVGLGFAVAASSLLAACLTHHWTSCDSAKDEDYRGVTGYLVAFAAGSFLYTGAADMVPLLVDGSDSGAASSGNPKLVFPPPVASGSAPEPASGLAPSTLALGTDFASPCGSLDNYAAIPASDPTQPLLGSQVQPSEASCCQLSPYARERICRFIVFSAGTVFGFALALGSEMCDFLCIPKSG